MSPIEVVVSVFILALASTIGAGWVMSIYFRFNREEMLGKR